MEKVFGIFFVTAAFCLVLTSTSLFAQTECDDGGSCECLFGETKECGLSTGVCEPGYRVCAAGVWSTECIDDVGPTEESCSNELDDDCDGAVDEDDCVVQAEAECLDGLIVRSCLCAGRTYTRGYCYNDYYFMEDPNPEFPFELVSILGALVLTVLMSILGIKEVQKFRSIHKLVSPEEQQKISVKPGGKLITKVMDVKNSTGESLGKRIKMYGRVKVSKYVSPNEIWYSFYDDTGIIALKSGKQLKFEYGEVEVVMKRSGLGYVYGEVV